jgi:hypothetical protein
MKPRYTAALALIGWSVLSTTPAFANRICQQDFISDISGSGATLKMESGQIYKVGHIDQFKASSWRSHLPVLVHICTPLLTLEGTVPSFDIINQGKSEEEVHATRIK